MSKSLWIISVLTTFLASIAGAEKLDIHTHDIVIAKLESVLPGLENQPSEGGVQMRLADLYADRARLKALEEEDKSCANCNGAKEDRKKSIDYYELAFNRVDQEQKAKALMQTAHLYALNGEIEKSKAVFENILKSQKKYSPNLVGEAHAGRAEVFYREGRFEKARKDYEKALQYPIQKKTYVQYRLSWCLLNSGRAREAKVMLITVLNSNKQEDVSLKKDAARDLATFIARDKITNETIDELMRLSPDDSKKSNLFYLGQEGDRLGNKAGSILVWKRYSELRGLDSDEAIEIQIRTAQNLWDQNRNLESLVIFDQFYKNIEKKGCGDKSVCDEMRARSRTYVLTWIKKEKTTPTDNLLSALKIYVNHNPEDVEISYWAGHIARHLKQNILAARYYAQTADESHKLNSSHSAKNEEATQKIFEGSLLAEIECAEQSGDLKSRENAYMHFISLNPQGNKSDEVRYQLAHLSYEKNQYKKAGEEFHGLVVEKNNLSSSLRVQAADLSLDCLALTRDLETLEKRALDYSRRISEKRLDYIAIARKSAINQAVAKYKSGKSSESDKNFALGKLKDAPLDGASEKEKISVYKNMIQVAEQLRDLDTVEEAASQIVKLKTVTNSDVEYAIGRKLWVAEMRLDFKNAFKLAKATPLSNLRDDQRYLKLAILTDLAGKDANTYYTKFLKSSRDIRKSNIVRAQMIHKSRHPWREISKNRTHLRKTPDIYAAVVAEAFAKNVSLSELKKYLSERAIRKSAYAPLFNRFVAIEDDKQLDRQFRRHRVKGRSDRELRNTLKERLALLRKAESKANSALRSGDFTLQILALNRVSRENGRLYREIVALPTPRGLSRAQRSQYRTLIQQQAKPYLDVATAADKKIGDLWASSSGYKQLLKLSEVEQGFTRNLVYRELNVLLSVAPKNQKDRLHRAMVAVSQEPRVYDIEKARIALQRDPFDRSKTERLRDLEFQKGSSTMAVFLDARLSAMKNGSYQ